MIERDLRLEEYDRERGACSDCGNPIAECSDPERVWYPYRRICYATMERESSRARYQALHGDESNAQYHDGTYTHWTGVRSPRTPIYFDEGVTIGVASHDVTPWDSFTKQVDAKPHPPSDVPAVDDDPNARHGD